MKSHNAAVAKRQLPRLAIDATPYTYDLESPSSSVPTSGSSAQASISTSVDTPYSAGYFHVLCLYDYEATDSDQLSFRRNEVLEIVQQEASGWWAALRQSDASVGWIPSAYVDPISEQTAELLRARGHKVHIQVNTERLNPPIGDERSPYGLGSAGDGIRGFEWMPLGDASSKNPSHVVSPVRFPNDVPATAIDSPFVDDIFSPGQVLTIPDTARIRAACPPSPSTPMPKPPLQVSLHNGPKSAPIRPSPSQFPQSPTPTKSPATVLFSRQFRRRPVLIDDSTSLSRLSTLFESSNVAEVDFIANSPVVVESFDAYARVARASVDKVKQITGDDDAQALYSAKVAQSALPWFLKPTHGEGEIKLEFDGTATAGTLSALVERLTIEHFTPALEKRYRHTFLSTYQTFCTAEELFSALLSRYHMKPPSDTNAEQAELWKQKKLRTSQKRVLSVFSAWLEHHRLVDYEPPVAQKLQEFLQTIQSPTGNKVTARQVMKTLERATFTLSPDLNSDSPQPHTHRRKRSLKHELHKMDAGILAEHICLYEQKLYSTIRPQDCLEYIKRQQGGGTERLIAFCKTHDRLANWVKSSILNVENVSKRAATLDVWIKVAEKCRAMNGFSSLSAIVAALTSTVLTRLHLTWAHVDRASQLEPLAAFNDPLNGFATYRSLQHETEDPCIPFIPMYLTDLMHANDQLPDFFPAGDESSPSLINFAKRQRLVDVVDFILRHQSKPYAFEQPEDPELMAFIEAGLSQGAEVDQALLWKQSQDVHRLEVIQADIRRGLEAAGF